MSADDGPSQHHTSGRVAHNLHEPARVVVDEGFGIGGERYLGYADLASTGEGFCFREAYVGYLRLRKYGAGGFIVVQAAVGECVHSHDMVGHAPALHGCHRR